MRAEAVTPALVARPGSISTCTVRVRNDGRGATDLAVRVLGLGDDPRPQPVPAAPLAPGAVLDVEVPFRVPEDIAGGEHPLALEVSFTAVGQRPVIVPLTLTVGSLDAVLLRAVPAILKGRRHRKFAIEVVNKRREAVEVELHGQSPDVEVAFETPAIVVPPDELRTVRARLTGPRRWWGDEQQHIVNIEARGGASPAYTTVSYRQRATIGKGVRGVVAVITVLALWAAIVGGAALWISRSGKSGSQNAASTTVASGGQGAAGGQTGSNQPGQSGTGAGGAAGAGAGGAAGPAGVPVVVAGAPTSTLVRGTVKAGKTGDDGGVVVTLTPLVAGADAASSTSSTSSTSPASQLAAGLLAASPLAVNPLAAFTRSAIGDAGGTSPAGAPLQTGGKFWSARYGTYAGTSFSGTRATKSVSTLNKNDGTFTISDVPLRRSYEVSFSKEHFDTKSLIVTPTNDNKPVDVNVVLAPAKASIGGIVYGPSGRLGGVQLSITDGTLTYSVTTSTDANTRGQWLIEGLSTPATYTISASLAGFGTEVLQAKLPVGQSNTNLSITMHNGVGSIRGLVSAAGTPLGGLTLTAAGQGITRTTTSLTDGATGTYLFPDLPVPGVYTVTASAPGYITQTRSVSLSPTGLLNATGVDFSMVRTTATLIGRVMSVNPKGGLPAPLPNASVEVVLDALTVRSNTAVSPDAGSFHITDLPPGTYTVTFGRYDHIPVTKLVTLAAGQVYDFGDVPLTYSPPAQLDPTGSVSVKVLSLTDTGPVDLFGSTVTLTDVAGQLPQLTTTMAAGSSSFTFQKVPVGTYRLTVTNEPLYQPFVQPRVVVALTDVPVQVTMVKYGQARGEVIDGLSPSPGTPLNNYELLIYQSVGTGLVCIAPVGVGAGVLPDPSGKINWQVDTNLHLLSGKYVLRFAPIAGETNPACAGRGKIPPGYASHPDASGAVGNFEVLDSYNGLPLVVPPIPVYPYPRVSGIAQAPLLSNGTITFANASVLAGANFAVNLRCGNASVAGTVNTSGDPVTFDISPASVASLFGSPQNAAGTTLGSCSILATANGFVTVDAALSTPLVIPLTGPYNDRVASIAMVTDPKSLSGSAYWRDLGGSGLHAIPTPSITASNVIIGFGTGDVIDTDGPGPGTTLAGNPPPVRRDLVGTSDTGGFWGFFLPGLRQVFGDATYVFTKTGFLDGTVTVRIDQNGRSVLADTGLVDHVDPATMGISMTPNPGSIAGSYTIDSTSATPPYAEAVVHATAPGASAPTDVSGTAAGTFSIGPAAAGTWQLEYGATASSNLWPAVGQGVDPVFVDVAQAQTAPAGHYVELGQASVEFSSGAVAHVEPFTVNGVTYPQVTLSQPTPATVYPAFAAQTVSAVTGGTAVVHRIPVDATDATGVDASFRLSVTAPGYEVNNATVNVFDAAGVLIWSGTNGDAIPISVRAGSHLRVTVNMPAYGSITGTVTGLLKPPNTSPGNIEHLDLATGLSVTYQQVADIAGTPLANPPASQSATRVAGTIPGFLISVPAGFYKVHYSAPDYVPLDVVYQVPNATTVDGSVDLLIAKGTFTLTVVTDTSSNTPVAGATVNLWDGTTSVATAESTTPLATLTTDASGVASFDPAAGTGLIPGTYLVIVRKADPVDATKDGYFPVIGTVSVPRGNTGGARTVSKRAVMPPTDGSIQGQVVAVSSAGRSVPLPASFTITRTYQTPQAGGTDGLNNTATEANQHPQPTSSVTPTHAASDSSVGYQFGGLARGVHTLAFSSAAAYQPIADVPVTVGGPTPTVVPNVQYVAKDVQVRINLSDSGGAVTGVGVVLTSSTGSAFTATEDPNQAGTYVIAALPPDSSAYTVAITAPFDRATNTSDLSQVVLPSSTAVTIAIPLTKFATITGSAVERLTTTTQQPLTDANAIRLVRASDGTTLQTTTADSNGGYRFEVTSVVASLVEASVTGFADGSVTVPTYTIGQNVTPATLNVDKLATATITVGGTPVNTATVTPSPSTGVAVTESPGGVFNVTGLNPNVGYTFTVSAPSRLSQTVPSTGVLTPAIGGNFSTTVTLELPRTITGVVTKNGTNVSGAAVSLLLNGTSVGSATTNSSGVYSIPNVGYGTYTIAASLLTVGAGTRTNVVVAVGGATTLTAQNVSLAARDIQVNFTTSPTAAQPLAVITINGVAGAAGATSFLVPEDGSFAWTATASGYVSQSGTVAIPGAYDFSAPLGASATFVLNVVNGSLTGNVPNNSVSVYLCADTAATAAACISGALQTGATSTTTFSFSGLAPGSYKLAAAKAATTAISSSFSVDATTGVANGGATVTVNFV